jgi:Tol biopolymer transport system component/DNA-binding winged helix-turn-helix (wHTH) protein
MTLELTHTTPAPFRLGEWSVAPDRNEIRRAGAVVRLEPLSMRLLCLLAENAGRTVSRAEIVHRLWDGRVVTDDAVGRQIAKLREAFDDDARRPAVIQTVPKVGVLLLPPVEPATSTRSEPALATAVAEPPPPPAAEHRVPPRRRWLLLGGGLAAAAAVAGVAAALVLLPEPPPGAGDSAEIPVTALVGIEQHPALSPSGAMLAYVSDAEPHGFGLYGRRVRQDDAVRLTTTGFDGCTPSWSPDGDQVAFVQHVHGKGGCEIAVVSPVSQKVRVIAQCRDARAGGIAWAGPAGLVFADRGESRSGQLQLYRAPIDGGAPVRLTNPPRGSRGDRRPVYVPDAHAVYFLRGLADDVTEIFRLDLATGQVTQVTRERSALHGLSSGGAGRLLVSAHNRGDLPPALWSLNLRDGGWTRRATGGEYRNVTSSADGRTVVFERPRSRFALVSYDPVRKQATSLTRTTQGEWFPTLSPTGDRLAFISSRSGAQQVWIGRPDGSKLEQLTFLERGSPEELAWAPDGRSLLMSWVAQGQYDLLQVDVASGALRHLSRTADSDEQHPFFGPDGGVFFTRRKAAEHLLIRRDPGTGQESVVARGVTKAVPAEGGAFYVTRPEQEGIWRLGGRATPIRVAPFPALAPPRNWTYREGAIWTLAGRLTRTDVATGHTENFGRLEGAFGYSGLEVRDGRVIYAQQSDFDVDLYRLGG